MTEIHAPQRALELEGASNFRDIGGYVGADGRTVRWRRIFRSDHLGGLTPADVALLIDLGLSRVCDFRGIDERTSAASAFDAAPVHSLPIEPSIAQKLDKLLAQGAVPGEAQTIALMQETYRNFVRAYTPRFASLFAHLLESDAPLVFHCTAGKDRTGFAAALVLLSLGVSRELVMEDYLLTNGRLKGVPKSHLPPHMAAILFRVQEPFLEAALEAVEALYGGIDRYLTDALGVGPVQRERLAALYLEPRNGS